jgi:hypothetical protein
MPSDSSNWHVLRVMIWLKRAHPQNVLNVLHVDFAPRPASSNACICSISTERIGWTRKTSAEARREQQNAGV